MALKALRSRHEPGLDAVLGRLAALVDLLADWSARINLTGHRGQREIVRGILGRALGLATILPREGTIADLGSGAGFPGLPLAILWPDRPVTLVESRAKRHHFQLHAVRSLGLANALPVLGRAEELEPRPHDLVVAQAVGPAERVIDLAIAWVAPGGQLVVPGLPEAPRSALAGLVGSPLTHYAMPVSGEPVPVWVGTRAAG